MPDHPVSVEGQPLASNIARVVQALETIGAPLAESLRTKLAAAGKAHDARQLQSLLDPRVLFVVHINPEGRVKVTRGSALARLQQAGYSAVLVKIINESRGTPRLRLSSLQAGPVHAGMQPLAAERMQQLHLRKNENTEGRSDRFLELELFTAPPMNAALSGLEAEYAIALIYSSEAGRREATLGFDAGQETQDLGFRAELAVLFDVAPAIAVTLRVADTDGRPTIGRFQFNDGQGHVFPPQSKRLAPDLFFQKHIYRADGESVLLPPGEFTMRYGRGPEYRWLERTVTIRPGAEIAVQLERWVDPAQHGFYSGDLHIHAAGCAHYTHPAEGVEPVDMFRQVKGEALNVGSVLTWGPGFDFQQQFFSSSLDATSEPLTILKYDVEVSGFGSQALGHLCLLNLREQIYPGADGSKGWPSWTLPVLRWARAQGAIGGYAHAGSGLRIDPAAATRRLLAQLDANRDGRLDSAEATGALLPQTFALTDTNLDGIVTEAELAASHDRVSDELPNFAIPELNGVGAQEIFVTAALGACDFISTMDTPRIAEWNVWYQLLNCGLPLKSAGETDFPCMSGTRVGQGRTYVRLGRQDRLDYGAWCEGVAKGRSYISDGYAHALEFSVSGRMPGDEIALAGPANISVTATVAFSPETPLEPPYGGVIPLTGRRTVGDTVVMHEMRALDPSYQRGRRQVELVVNGQPVATREVVADGREHQLEFNLVVERSSWVALRAFPELHTNPVNVIVGGRPIRAARESALWAARCVDQLWEARSARIAPAEREEARKAYDQARAVYRRIAEESPVTR